MDIERINDSSTEDTRYFFHSGIGTDTKNYITTGTLGAGATTLTGNLTVGSSTIGYNETINATLGVEQAPALTTPNWTLGASWRYLTSPDRLDKYADGVDAATPAGASPIVIGVTYKIVTVVDSLSGGSTFTPKFGGKGGGIITAAGTYTDYITPVTTGNISYNSQINGGRITISSVSIIPITDATGDLSIGGNLNVNSPVLFNSDAYVGGALAIGTPLLQVAGPRLYVKNNGNSQFTRCGLFEQVQGNASNIVSPFCFRNSLDSLQMNDGFGVGILMAVQDVDGVENLLVRFGGIRYGADNTGKFRIDVGSAGTLTTEVTIVTNGFAIGNFVPTARLHLPAGTATANTAPLKFTAGALLTTPEAGVIEYVTGKFVIRSDNLGIGGSPSATSLDIFGTPALTPLVRIGKTSGTAVTTSAYYLQIGGEEYAGSPPNGYWLIGFGYKSISENPPAYIGYTQTGSNDNNTNGDLIFGTRSVETNTDPTIRFRIKADGNSLVSSTGQLQFNATTEYINSANAGYLDLNANTGIRINTAVTLTSITTMGGTAPVADGTYTVGARLTPVTGIDGTITVKSGIITAIQPAT